MRGHAVTRGDLSEGFIWAVQDITQQQQLEDELRLLASTFRTGQATMIADPEGRIERVRPAFTTITGYRPRGSHRPQSPYPSIRLPRCPALTGHVATDPGERPLGRRDLEPTPKRRYLPGLRIDRGGPQRSRAKRALRHRLARHQRAKTSWAELDYRASHDSLTGLLNRKHLEQLIGEEINRAEHYSSTFSLISHFKAVNARHGHPIGDQVLIHTARKGSA
ncbi:sensor domain-containing diguanylate cyclase [Thiohalorhabdus sp.]|uniref:sensor domain-containing diguanylate cyclase n=1 Tax=Thiohalorhabdus sp. TaxID=3094134 RepID=UPI002FC2A6CC